MDRIQWGCCRRSALFRMDAEAWPSRNSATSATAVWSSEDVAVTIRRQVQMIQHRLSGLAHSQPPVAT